MQRARAPVRLRLRSLAPAQPQKRHRPGAFRFRARSTPLRNPKRRRRLSSAARRLSRQLRIQRWPPLWPALHSRLRRALAQGPLRLRLRYQPYFRSRFRALLLIFLPISRGPAERNPERRLPFAFAQRRLQWRQPLPGSHRSKGLEGLARQRPGSASGNSARGAACSGDLSTTVRRSRFIWL